MKYKITRNINRIQLHDTSILSFELSDDFIILKFNWAKITSYGQEKLESLILGNCELKLNGIRETLLEKETSAGKNEINFPQNFPEGFEEILENGSKNDNELVLKGFMIINGDYLWVNWKIKFEKFEFSWDAHATLDEWKLCYLRG